MFQKDVGNISANEGLLYNYWHTVLALLDAGLPWDYIEDMAPTEITLVLAILISRKEREAEAQASTMVGRM